MKKDLSLLYSAPKDMQQMAPSVASASALASRTLPPVAGAFVEGGTIPSGKIGIVGENGPELAYSGSKDMQILPKSSSEGRGVNIVNHFTIHSPNGTISRASQMQVAAAAARTLGQANQRTTDDKHKSGELFDSRDHSRALLARARLARMYFDATRRAIAC